MAKKTGRPGQQKLSRNAVARALAAKHFQLEEGISHIFRVHAEDETHVRSNEPIKLLEVNENTVAVGILPVHFGASSTIPYPSIIIEVTPVEFTKIVSRELELPQGWILGEEIPRSQSNNGAR